MLACARAAADVANLEAGLPTEIADAEPMESGEREFQMAAVWDRERSGANRVLLEPQLQWGFAQRWQAAVNLRGVFGSADRAGSGDVRLEVLRKLNDEGRRLPAFAALVRLDVPTGRDTRGVDTTLRLIATKTLGEQPHTHQVHVNAGWIRNASPTVQERPDRGRLLIGYSTLLAERTVLVADVIHEHERERGQRASLAEVGLRRQFGRDTLVSLGLGAGQGGASAARWRAVFGLEQMF